MTTGMGSVDLVGIVIRSEHSIIWGPDTEASDPLINDRLWQATQDRRALLGLLRDELLDQDVALALRLATNGLPNTDRLVMAMDRRQAVLSSLDPATTEPKEPE